MSKVKIEGNASGTGTLTISAPNTNTDRSLTLPDGAGEILTSASTLSSSNLSGALPAIDGSALTGISAAVKQYAYGEYTTEIFQNTSTWTDINLSASITPTSSSSKIIVIVGLHYAVSANPSGFGFRLLRDSTTIYIDYDFEGQYLGSAYGNFKGIWMEEDSPASTSALTYKVQASTAPNGAYFHRSGNKSSILLLEV